MAVKRKDKNGCVLHDGETYGNSDGWYMYRYYFSHGRHHSVYAGNLNELSEKEEKIQEDLEKGIRVGEDQITLNQVFQI